MRKVYSKDVAGRMNDVLHGERSTKTEEDVQSTKKKKKVKPKKATGKNDQPKKETLISVFGKNKKIINSFKVIYCLFIIVGSAASLDSVIRLADSLFFCMVVPNLIGVYFLLPVVKSELSKYMEHVKKTDEIS